MRKSRALATHSPGDALAIPGEGAPDRDRFLAVLDFIRERRASQMAEFVSYEYLVRAVFEPPCGERRGILLTNGIFVHGVTAMHAYQLSQVLSNSLIGVVLIASDRVARKLAGGAVSPLYDRVIAVCSSLLHVFVAEWDDPTIDVALEELKPTVWYPGFDWPNASTFDAKREAAKADKLRFRRPVAALPGETGVPA